MTTKPTTIKTGVLYRTCTIEARADDAADDRNVDLAFSSEAPVDRWFGAEILDHLKSSVDLSRFADGRGPVLMEHDPEQHVGVVETANIGSDRVGRATVRLGKTARADDALTDIRDGIKTCVSVGYRINRMVQEESEPEKPVFRATDWTPVEISFVAMPADITVGIGRGEPGDFETIVEREEIMSNEPTTTETSLTRTEPAPAPAPTATPQPINHEPAPADPDKIARDACDAERTRSAEIKAIGVKLDMRSIADKAIADGTSVEAFRGLVVESLPEGKALDASAVNLDLSPGELKNFSISRALLAQYDYKTTGDPRKLEDARFEFECSDEIAKRLKKQPSGFYVPLDAQMKRNSVDLRNPEHLQTLGRADRAAAMDLLLRTDLTVGGSTTGAKLKGVDQLGGSFIEILRNSMMTRFLGATILSGLRGDIAIPRQSGTATTYWVDENVAITEGNQTFDQVLMAPKTIGAFTDMSRKLLIQSDPSVDALVNADLAMGIALGIDLAAINGSGSSGQPTGILNTSGIGDVADAATDGGAPTWAKIVELETDVAIANGLVSSMAYLTNAKMRGKLKTVQKASNLPFIWETGDSPVNGYPALVSNQVPSNLTKGSGTSLSAMIFGNWRDLIIAEWGVLDVVVDVYTGIAAGTTRIRVMQDLDIAVRHAESFSALQDADTG